MTARSWLRLSATCEGALAQRNLVIAIVVVGALAGGGVAYWLTAPPPAPPAPPKVAEHVAAAPKKPPPAAVPTQTENLIAPGVDLEGGASPASAARAPAGLTDDPEQRKRLERTADLGAPYWAKIAPHIQDPEMRARAAAMSERLRALNEPTTILAHEQYALTQGLISIGGWDRGTLLNLQYLNSLAATVLQGGDPDALPTPEQEATFKPRGRKE